jgi:hypothetical protein
MVSIQKAQNLLQYVSCTFANRSTWSESATTTVSPNSNSLLDVEHVRASQSHDGGGRERHIQQNIHGLLASWVCGEGETCSCMQTESLGEHETRCERRGQRTKLSGREGIHREDRGYRRRRRKFHSLECCFRRKVWKRSRRRVDTRL